MANVRRILTVVIAMMSAPLNGEAVENDRRPSIRVHVENHADIKASLLVGAEQEVAHIYDSAGVRFVWSTRPEHEDCAATLTIHVVLMSVGMEERLARGTSAASKVLGQANREARRVYVFWSRVDAQTSHTMIEVGDGLGFVIARELGHVLLASGHSATGIMQENFLVHAIYSQRFTLEQAVEIRAFITAAGNQPVALDAKR
jgi:hypothetical protein